MNLLPGEQAESQTAQPTPVKPNANDLLTIPPRSVIFDIKPAGVISAKPSSQKQTPAARIKPQGFAFFHGSKGSTYFLANSAAFCLATISSWMLPGTRA